VSAYVALLRGINVAGHRKVPMASLRDAVEGLGYGDISTYLQSGNVVLTAVRAKPAAIETAIAEQIEGWFGFDVGVLVRTARELTTIVQRNPFLAERADPATLHVVFCSVPPPARAWAGLDGDRFFPDRFTPIGREIFLHCPNGYGRTKLTNARFERALGTPVTTRNWKTVTNLAALAADVS
jgi:uncharacterized protein (DUF1697 family)